MVGAGTTAIAAGATANVSVRSRALLTMPEPLATNRLGLLNFEIYSMNADGTNQMRLTTNSALDFNPDR